VVSHYGCGGVEKLRNFLVGLVREYFGEEVCIVAPAGFDELLAWRGALDAGSAGDVLWGERATNVVFFFSCGHGVGLTVLGGGGWGGGRAWRTAEEG